MEEFKIIYNENFDSVKRVPNRLARTIALYTFVLLFVNSIFTAAYNKLYYLGQLTINNKTYNFLKIVIIIFFVLNILLIESFIGNKRAQKDALDEKLILHNNAIRLQRFIKDGAEIELLSNNIVRVKHKHRTYLFALNEGIVDIYSRIIDFTKEKNKL